MPLATQPLAGGHVTLPAAIGPYRIVAAPGRGGMGTVFGAVDPDSQRRLALKLLRGAQEVAIRRFTREFRALQGLDHPGSTASPTLRFGPFAHHERVLQEAQ